MNVLGIIPARGGSVGIPRKNLAVVGGKTLLDWAIDSAQGTRLTSLVVSTNDNDIAIRAMERKVTVLWRPEELSQGEAVPGSSSTFRACRWHVNQMDVKPDAVMILQPTCPLRRPEDIDAAIERMEETGCEMVISYVPLPGIYPERMATISLCGMVAGSISRWSEHKFLPRQNLERYYLRSGDVYLIDAASLLDDRSGLHNTDTRAIIIPPERHLNIDTPADLERAEQILGKRMQVVATGTALEVRGVAH